MRRRGTRLASAGQVLQLASVSTAESTPRPYQLCCRPCCSSSGTSVPDAATPRPTPAKITPPTMPRLPRRDTCGRMVEAASTMITPPVRPGEKAPGKEPDERHRRSSRQRRRGWPAASSPRSARTAPMRVAELARKQRAGEIAGEIGRAEINASAGAEPFAAINAGISGV